MFEENRLPEAVAAKDVVIHEHIEGKLYENAFNKIERDLRAETGIAKVGRQARNKVIR